MRNRTAISRKTRILPLDHQDLLQLKQFFIILVFLALVKKQNDILNFCFDLPKKQNDILNFCFERP